MWIAPGARPNGSFQAELFDVGGKLKSFDPVGGSPRRTVFMDKPIALVEGLSGCEVADDRDCLLRMGFDGALVRLSDGTFEARPAHGWQVETLAA
jgi:hypothetical protein